ncbi:ankyrin [Dentipellis sp. KUC8613]|nr:ankyrin [Dentipellis sp. KUC8613]
MVRTTQNYPSQNAEANAFLNRLAKIPPRGPVSLDDVLLPSLDDEAELRKLFAQDKAHARLADKHVGLVDVFAAPRNARVTRARVVADDADLIAKYVMPLPASRRRADHAPAVVEDLDEFKKNWAIFTEGSLSQLFDWNNVVAAGGSVLACMTPVPDVAKASKRSMRKYFHEAAYPTSDIDLFLWGMTPEQAENKIRAIYDAVRDSVPWDVTCVRTKHTVSIHSQYPYRSVQIVLRLYQSPAEILAGFDVDAPCSLYDGQRVYANPRAIVAMIRQCNTVDMTRRSPSYEVRLAKYSMRGFEVYISNLRRADIDPTIFERSINRIQGLGRLLVLEKLADPDSRVRYLNDRSTLRGRPLVANYYYSRQSRQARKYNGDLKSQAAFSGLEMNDYDVVSLHIPYGPGWTCGRIEKLIYKTDLGMNTPYNPKNEHRRLHRHPAFFGAIEHCLEDCCECCPEPRNKEEHELQDEEDKVYVRGRIAFIEEDPGRQSMSGSFNPIDEGEWSEQAYVQAVAKFFAAISTGDRVGVKQMIEDGEDVNRRDYVGRTALHYALLAGQPAIACDLVDAGARMTARLPGGRSALHLAAQTGHAAVIRKMLERSAVNEEKAKEEEELRKKKEEEAAMEVEDDERPSSEDDWSSEGDEDDDEDGDEDEQEKAEPKDDTNVLDDNEEEPDILDVNMTDWDYLFSPLAFAIIAGSLDCVEALLTAGVDPKATSKGKDGGSYQPLSMTMYTDDEDRAVEIAARLLGSGVTSSMSDSLATDFHRFVAARKTKLVSAVLRRDANAKIVVEHPATINFDLAFPIVGSIGVGDYATVAVLLAHGAKLNYTEEEVSKAADARGVLWNLNAGKHWQSKIYLPVEVALARHDYIVPMLISLGAEANFKIKRFANLDPTLQHTVLDWTRKALKYYNPAEFFKRDEVTTERPMDAPAGDSWSEYKAYLKSFESTHYVRHVPDKESPADIARIYSYIQEMETVLVEHGSEPNPTPAAKPATPAIVQQNFPKVSGYKRHSAYSNYDLVPLHLKVLYDELYEACWNGDNARIEELCLPKHPSKTDPPLQISVQTAHPANHSEHSPLSVAIQRRKWDTARLILAIAYAQYFPNEVTERFNVNDLVGDDDDEDDEDDEDDDVDMDDSEVDLTDIAERPSAVHCKASPSRMLTNTHGLWISKDGKSHDTPIMERAVMEDDFEAFVKICDLYKAVDEDLWPNSYVPDYIMKWDRPDMLDELIRRTGCSINVPVVAKDGDDDVVVDGKPISKERVYLGLNIQGKKRKDLATRRTNNRERLYKSLLHDAVLAGASRIVDYLATDRPLQAFRYYGSTHTNPRGTFLRETKDLESVLPGWLGWEINSLNESPLTAAINLGQDRFGIIKQLFEKKPQLMLDAMNAVVKFVGVNALTLAVYSSVRKDDESNTELLDFFLDKGCDASIRDSRGWNIYHLAAVAVNDATRASTLEHLLKVLPKDMTDALMLQQSKEALNTPLMLAVKRGRTATVEVMLKHGLDASIFSLRDTKGSIPLHIAVQNCNDEMARLLIRHGPPECLFIENGVGQTAVDVAIQKRLNALQACRMGSISAPQILAVPIYNVGRVPLQLDELEEQVPKLRATLDGLLQEGQLKQGTKLATELSVFTGQMEAKLAVLQSEAAQKAADKPEGRAVDPRNAKTDVYAVADIVRAAVAQTKGHRKLVHLLDVQKSVQANLERYIVEEDPQKVLEQKMKQTDGFAPEPVAEDPAELQGPQKIVVLSGKDGW